MNTKSLCVQKYFFTRKIYKCLKCISVSQTKILRFKNFYCQILVGASIYLHIFSILLMVSGISGFSRPSDLNIRSMWYLQTLVRFIFTLSWESLNTINNRISFVNGINTSGWKLDLHLRWCVHLNKKVFCVWMLS